MTTDLHYVSGQSIIPPDAFGISPSGVSKFLDKTHEWYREMVLGEKSFTGSTSTVLGTCVHYCAEQYIKHKKVNYIEIYKYLYTQCCTPDPAIEEQFLSYAPFELSASDESDIIAWLRKNSTNPDIDCNYILDQWRPMGQALISHLIKTGIPQQSEPMFCAEVIPNYWASGSIDAIKGDMIIDYKTTSEKSPKSYIPMNYKYQLLTYAWICSKNNIPIDRISIIWVTNNEVGRISEVTGKPLKDYPAQAVQVTEQITKADIDFIESILTMIASTVQASKDQPDLTWLLFKDPRLKAI